MTNRLETISTEPQSDPVIITPIESIIPGIEKRYTRMQLREYQSHHPILGQIKKLYYKLINRI